MKYVNKPKAEKPGVDDIQSFEVPR